MVDKQLLSPMKNSPDEHKWRTFLLTFISYSGLHIMRMTYSHSKPNFKSSFHQSNLTLGIFDALTYTFLGIGFFFRFLLQDQKQLTKSFLTFITFGCIGYSCLPLISLFLGEKVLQVQILRVGIPALSFMLFGFFQFPAWPTLMTITSQHFDIKSEGKALGVWSANGDFGNILGFAISGIIVDTLSLRWEIAMLIAAAINWSLALLVYFLVDDNYHRESTSLVQTDDIELSEEEKETSGKQRFNIFLQYCKKVTSFPENKLYLFSMGLMKAILYGFLLWMPTYLAHIHLAAYKSIIPIIFNAGTLLGSFLLGHLYEDIDQSSSPLTKNIKNYFLVYSCVGVIITLALFYCLHAGIGLYFVLSAVSGAFLGGCFNMLASNEVISITKGRREEINYLSTLSMSVGNLMVGAVQVIIGVVLDVSNDPQGEHKLFVILVGVGLFAIGILLWRNRLIVQKQQL